MRGADALTMPADIGISSGRWRRINPESCPGRSAIGAVWRPRLFLLDNSMISHRKFRDFFSTSHSKPASRCSRTYSLDRGDGSESIATTPEGPVT